MLNKEKNATDSVCVQNCSIVIFETLSARWIWERYESQTLINLWAFTAGEKSDLIYVDEATQK